MVRGAVADCDIRSVAGKIPKDVISVKLEPHTLEALKQSVCVLGQKVLAPFSKRDPADLVGFSGLFQIDCALKVGSTLSHRLSRFEQPVAAFRKRKSRLPPVKQLQADLVLKSGNVTPGGRLRDRQGVCSFADTLMFCDGKEHPDVIPVQIMNIHF